MEGKVALITGGASGLGKATIEIFVKLRIKVVFCDLPESGGGKIAQELGEDVVFVPANVTSEEELLAAYNVVEEKFGRLNYIVNCAGIADGGAIYDFENDRPLPLEDFMKVINVNLVGTFNAIRLGIQLLKRNEPIDGEKGVIINTSSICGKDCTPGRIAYAASKAAVAGITLPLARELASQGIRVCTIAPGAMDTPMIGNPSDQGVLDYFEKRIMFPTRLGKPSEFAQLVQSIIENQMLNGEVIRLDAGARL